ncbi:MAG: antiterminator LoaP [Spirochaetaceae bacterium]
MSVQIIRLERTISSYLFLNFGARSVSMRETCRSPVAMIGCIEIMDYYVLQVYTGEEERYMRLAEKEIGGRARLIWPRRQLNIRKRGVRKKVLAPLFPGYLFLETDQLTVPLISSLRQVSGFVRLLETTATPKPLAGNDLELVRHFLGFGEVVKESKVTFDEKSRIEVIEGPLQGLEGRIVKVDKRKGRAKVRLDLYKDSFLVDLGFEILSHSRSNNVE